MVEDGIPVVIATCGMCGEQKHTPIYVATLQDSGNGDYAYDYVFTPDESGIYEICGMSAQDTFVELYQVVNGEYQLMTVSDDDTHNMQFR